MTTCYSNDSTPILTRYTGSAALLSAIRAAATMAFEIAPDSEFPDRYRAGIYPFTVSAEFEIGAELVTGPRTETGRQLIKTEGPASRWPLLEVYAESLGPFLPLTDDRRVTFHFQSDGSRGSMQVVNVRADLLRLADKVHANRAVFDGKVKKTKCPDAVTGARGSAPHVAARALWAERDYAGAIALAQNFGAVFVGAGSKPGEQGHVYMRAESVDVAGHPFVIARSIASGKFQVVHVGSGLSVNPSRLEADPSGYGRSGFVSHSAALDWVETAAQCDAWRDKLNTAIAQAAPLDQCAALAHYLGAPAEETGSEARAAEVSAPVPADPVTTGEDRIELLRAAREVFARAARDDLAHAGSPPTRETTNQPADPVPVNSAPLPVKPEAAPINIPQPEPVAAIEPDVFIRRATNAERVGSAPRQRAMRSIVPMPGHTVMFKPYGHKGAGFYWVLDRAVPVSPTREFEPVADAFDAMPNDPQSPKPTFGRYRYAPQTGQTVVAFCPSVDGYKTRASRLAEYCKFRYVGRAGGYVGTEKKADYLRELFAAGFDASAYLQKLIPPTQADSVEPLPGKCDHPPRRLFAGYATQADGQTGQWVACCDCGEVLRGGATLSEAEQHDEDERDTGYAAILAANRLAVIGAAPLDAEKDDDAIPAPLDGLDVAELTGPEAMAEFERAQREPVPTAPAYREITVRMPTRPHPVLRIPDRDPRARIPARFAPCYVLQA